MDKTKTGIITVQIEKSLLKEVIRILRKCAWNDSSLRKIYNKMENLEEVKN